jgi:hypothetical protein
MNVSGFKRSALATAAAAALLVACGKTQLPSAASAPQMQHLQSWIAPDTARDALLYVSNTWYRNAVSIYRLGATKAVGMLTGFVLPLGLCSDSSGDVYVVDDGAGKIYEYPHGNKHSIKTLVDPYAAPNACAFDKTTGNLAVTDNTNGVLIYPRASGSPTPYVDHYLGSYNFVAYDDRGDLLVDGAGGSASQFAELRKGSSVLTSIALNAKLVAPEGIAWDGKYFAICDQGRLPNVVDYFSISGSSGTLQGTVTLDDSVTLLGITISPFGYAKGKLPKNKEIIGADVNNDARKGYVWYWRYPNGGSPIKMIVHEVREPVGVAVSLDTK